MKHRREKMRQKVTQSAEGVGGREREDAWRQQNLIVARCFRGEGGRVELAGTNRQ